MTLPHDRPPAPLAAAWAALHEGRLDAAAQACAEILADAPAQGAALHLLGMVHWRRGEGARAIALLQHAVAGDGADSLWHRDLTEMCRTEGRLDEALLHGEW